MGSRCSAKGGGRARRRGEKEGTLVSPTPSCRRNANEAKNTLD
jgi:hypothetical protein